MKKLSRRDFLRKSALVAGAAAVLPATTVSAKAPAVPAAADPKTIQWWVGWGNYEPSVKKMMETPELKAILGSNKLEFKGSVAAEAILTAVAAGTPPDGGSNFQYPNFFYRGALKPVDDMVKASKVIVKEDVVEKLWEASFYDGKMIGVPGIEGFMWWGLNYNSQAAKDAGLDAEKPPLTWEENLEWHKKLTKFDSAGNLKQMGLDPYDAMAGEPDFGMQSFGGMNWWDEKTRKMTLNNDAMIKCMDMCGEFIRVVGADKFAGMRQVEGQGGWGAAYNAGTQTMIMEGYWHPGETQIQKPEIAKLNKATWAPVPASRKGAKIMATGPHFVILFKDAKNTDEMFKVAEYLITDPALDITLKEVGWMFGKKSWMKKVDAKLYPGLDFYIKAVDEVTEWIIGRRCPIHWFVAEQYTQLREKVFRNQMSAKDAAAELQKRADAEWKAQGLK